MNKRLLPLSAILLLAMLLTACQLPMQPGAAAASPTPAVIKVTATPRATLTPRPTAAPSATSAPFAAAQAAVEAYAEALRKGDFAAASKMVSQYSLMVSQLTAGGIETSMKAGGDAARLANFKLLGIKAAGETTVLAQVSYISGKDAADKEESWPFRLENGAWRYNWDNLVDFHTLTVDPQTTNGVTFIPTRLVRYSDRTVLELMGQNRTNEPIVFGQPNETLARFLVDGQKVEAEKTFLALDALRTTPNLQLVLKGYYPVYPSAVEIRIWRDFNEKPWFTFELP